MTQTAQSESDEWGYNAAKYARRMKERRKARWLAAMARYAAERKTPEPVSTDKKWRADTDAEGNRIAILSTPSGDIRMPYVSMLFGQDG